MYDSTAAKLYHQIMDADTYLHPSGVNGTLTPTLEKFLSTQDNYMIAGIRWLFPASVGTKLTYG